LLTLVQLNENPRKDGFVDVAIYSPVPTLFVDLWAGNRDVIISEQTVTLTNNKAVVRILIEKHYLHSITIRAQSVFDNEVFDEQFEVSLENERDIITIEAETFRNKIYPGTSENWTFKLSPKNLADAEVLASMYDSSLDKFSMAAWQGLDFYRYSQSLPSKTRMFFDTSQ